jgi:broad specificity phosphatase PhoE
VVTIVLLARHAQTEWNRQGRFQGHADPELTAEGRAQARTLADELEDTEFAAVYSSDLRRAVETAQIVAKRHGLEVETDPDLREVDVGEWSGLTWGEIEERYPDGVVRHRERGHGWERGESYEAMTDRVLSALRRIASQHDGDQVLVVVHGGTMRALAAHVASEGVVEHRRSASAVRNCEVRVITIEDGVLRAALASPRTDGQTYGWLG